MIYAMDPRIIAGLNSPTTREKGRLISAEMIPVEIPIGILTSVLGIPIFAVILRNAGKGWGKWS